PGGRYGGQDCPGDGQGLRFWAFAGYGGYPLFCPDRGAEGGRWSHAEAALSATAGCKAEHDFRGAFERAVMGLSFSSYFKRRSYAVRPLSLEDCEALAAIH